MVRNFSIKIYSDKTKEIVEDIYIDKIRDKKAIHIKEEGKNILNII